VQGIVTYFQEDFLGPALLQKEEMEIIQQLFQKSRRGLAITGLTNARVTAMMQELLSLSGVASIIQLLKILETLAYSEELDYLAEAGYFNNYKETEATRINKVHKYVMDHFRQDICLAEVASLASMTPTSFSRYFKTRANKSFSTFISEIRVGHACKLLHETERSITDICYASGFNTLSNFNKQFKDITGTSPSRYKEELFKTTRAQ
jgi:AraC-like DNA-binding protein